MVSAREDRAASEPPYSSVGCSTGSFPISPASGPARLLRSKKAGRSISERRRRGVDRIDPRIHSFAPSATMAFATAERMDESG
jgi:hypothetical protein